MLVIDLSKGKDHSEALQRFKMQMMYPNSSVVTTIIKKMNPRYEDHDQLFKETKKKLDEAVNKFILKLTPSEEELTKEMQGFIKKLERDGKPETQENITYCTQIGIGPFKRGGKISVEQINSNWTWEQYKTTNCGGKVFFVLEGHWSEYRHCGKEGKPRLYEVPSILTKNGFSEHRMMLK
jgi:hypothetical protein